MNLSDFFETNSTSPGGEAHIGFGYTKPDERFGFNIFEVADEIYDYIMKG